MPQLPRIASDPDQPAPADPVVTDPVVADPVVTDPVVTDPVVTDPVVTDPVVTDPVVADPVMTDPELTTALDRLAETAAELSLDAGTLQDQRAIRDALHRLRTQALAARP